MVLAATVVAAPGIPQMLSPLEPGMVDRLVADVELPPDVLDREAAGRPTFTLVIGSDRRGTLPAAPSTAFGDVAGARADALEMVERRPGGGVQVLGIPRDLRVTVPGHGVRKLSATYEYGLPSMVAAVRRTTGLPVHHVVEVDFAGLVAAVDAAGGIVLDFPFPARDVVTGFRTSAGRHRLDGTTALAYARSRQYEEFRGGRWLPVGASDLGRIRRQQRVLAVLTHSGTALLSDPIRLLSLLRAARGHLAKDRKLSAHAFLGLATGLSQPGGTLAALPARQALPDRAERSPFQPVHYGSVDYVVLVQPAAARLLDAFRSGRPLPAAKVTRR